MKGPNCWGLEFMRLMASYHAIGAHGGTGIEDTFLRGPLSWMKSQKWRWSYREAVSCCGFYEMYASIEGIGCSMGVSKN